MKHMLKVTKLIQLFLDTCILTTVFLLFFFLNDGFLVNHIQSCSMSNIVCLEKELFIGILNEFTTVWKIGKVFATWKSRFFHRSNNYPDFVKQISVGDRLVFFSWHMGWVIHELCPIYILIDPTTDIVIFQFTGVVRDEIACRLCIRKRIFDESIDSTISHAIMTLQISDADNRLIFRKIQNAD